MTLRVTVPGRLLPVVYKDAKAWAADARRRREVLEPPRGTRTGRWQSKTPNITNHKTKRGAR